MAVISELNIYPVKSLRGISLNHVALGVRGLQYDRNWMLVDEAGKFLSQRQVPELALIGVSLNNDSMVFSKDGQAPLKISLVHERRQPVEVKVWDDMCEATDEGSEASSWFNKALEGKFTSHVRLVRIEDSFRRVVDRELLQDNEVHTAFADRYPYLVAWEEALLILNERLKARGVRPVTMDRFRANIVLKGLPAGASDGDVRALESINQSYRLRLIKPCKRCKIVGIDQITAQPNDPPNEPLATLVSMNSDINDKSAYFGHRAILAKGASHLARVGDEVNALLA